MPVRHVLESIGALNRRFASTFALLAFPAAAYPSVAQAELGGGLTSVAPDRARMQASLTTTAQGGYSRHIMVRSNGGQVHELTNAQGHVFAVVWAGPGKPDLRSLLGTHFAAYQDSLTSTPRRLRGLRRPAEVDKPDLVVQTAGHMGFFRGVAFIPSLAPPNFSPNDLVIA